ncbi:MAG: hypothetical protein Q8K98_12560 [Bacteroidota bacterium]|nr:hypothetical protein [Bacteroidota bacterium]
MVCLIYFNTKSFCQEYPKWFIEQGKIDANNTAVGYARLSFYTDSSTALAFKNACENYARNKNSRITGGQAFWATEIGTFWMGHNFKETYDTLQYFKALNSFKGIDTLITDKLIIILIGDSNNVSDQLQPERISFSDIKSPVWINSPPTDSLFIPAVGIAPEYFYETSSWLEAERLARLNLARQICTKLKSIQKADNYEGQEVRHEETYVDLQNIIITARWRDLQKKLFYVLIKMSK